MSGNIDVNWQALLNLARQNRADISKSVKDVATALQPVGQLASSSIFGPSPAGSWMDRVLGAAAADLAAMVDEVDKAGKSLVDAVEASAANAGKADEAATVAYVAQANALGNRTPVSATRTIPPAPTVDPPPATAPTADSAGGTP